MKGNTYGTAQKGIPKSEEHKRKISEGNKGKPKTEEHCRKMSENRKGKGLGNTNGTGNKGRTQSLESRNKRSLSMKETIAKKKEAKRIADLNSDQSVE
jgi:hypothetical protein